MNRSEPDAPTESEIRFQISLLAAVTATAAALLARFLFDAPLLPEQLAHFFFAIAPIWTVEMAVGILGSFAKHLAFLFCVLLYGLAQLYAATAFLRYVYSRAEGKGKIVAVASLAAFAWAASALLLLPALGGGVLGRYLPQGTVITSLSLLVTSGVYGAAVWVIARMYLDKPERAQPGRLSRRRVVRGIWYAIVAVAVYDMGRSLLTSILQLGSGRVKGGDGVFPNIDGLAIEVTPTEDFYVVSKNPFDPQPDTDRWRLEVAGLFQQPVTLTYEELKRLPSVEQYATLECIDNKVGGDLIGNALWRGVRLKTLLDLAGLQPGVVDVVFRAADGYRDSIPLDRALNDGTLLAYEMNGEPLTHPHGFPLRLIVPGIYGMKNVKWVTRIEAVSFDLKGYWQSRGWDDRAIYKTMSRIDAPEDEVSGETSIAGIAFAGDRGVSRVEVSTDGGKTWKEAEIKTPLSPYTWVLWHLRWSPEKAGSHTLVVRATDGLGATQTSQYAPASPDGTSGYHRISLEVDG